MKAIVQSQYGPPERFQLKDIDRPTIGDKQVLVRVVAAGVDPGVWHLGAGQPYFIRLGMGLRRPRQPVMGWDLAGVVAAVGAKVTAFEPGAQVYGSGTGTYAEYAVAKPGKLAAKPPRLSFAEAAAVPVSGITALQALRDKAKVQSGHHVLIIGAGGGVGTYAVQIAKAYGAEVTGVCGTDKTELVASLGADHVVDYTAEDVTEREHRFDAILDIAGNRPLSRLRAVLSPRGALVIIGGESDRPALFGMGRQLRASATTPFTGQRLIMLIANTNTADLETLAELIADGKVDPVLTETYRLDQAGDAVQRLYEGHARGKAVIAVADADAQK